MKKVSFLLFTMMSVVGLCQTSTNISASCGQIIIKTFPTGIFGSNCHVVSRNGVGFVVDAGSSDTTILQYIRENNISIKYIFCTHSHIDHVLFAPEGRQYLGAKVVLHREDASHYKYYTKERINEWIKTGEMNADQMPAINKFINIKYDTLINGRETFDIGGMNVEIIHTPGHSRGSVCLLVDGKYLFSGDTMTDDSIGRTDIDTGNYNDLVTSIDQKIKKLDQGCMVYQGHGDARNLKVLLSMIRL